MRELLIGLFDDAALFPPGSAPLAAALHEHAEHRSGPHADLVGPFVIPADRVDEVAAALWAPTAVSVTVTDGPAAARGVAERVRGLPNLVLRSVEVALPITVPLDPLDELAALGAPRTYIEIPRDSRRDDVLDRLTGTGMFAKLRTGGVTAQAHPDSDELAHVLGRLTRSGIAFKATAGLHRAVRHRDGATGFEQHGFLNVMLAVHRTLSGTGEKKVAAVLEDRDGERVADRLRRLDAAEVTLLRKTFRSVGTCSIAEPLADLVALGLIPESSVAR